MKYYKKGNANLIATTGDQKSVGYFANTAKQWKQAGFSLISHSHIHPSGSTNPSGHNVDGSLDRNTGDTGFLSLWKKYLVIKLILICIQKKEVQYINMMEKMKIQDIKDKMLIFLVLLLISCDNKNEIIKTSDLLDIYLNEIPTGNFDISYIDSYITSNNSNSKYRVITITNASNDANYFRNKKKLYKSFFKNKIFYTDSDSLVNNQLSIINDLKWKFVIEHVDSVDVVLPDSYPYVQIKYNLSDNKVTSVYTNR